VWVGAAFRPSRWFRRTRPLAGGRDSAMPHGGVPQNSHLFLVQNSRRGTRFTFFFRSSSGALVHSISPLLSSRRGSYPSASSYYLARHRRLCHSNLRAKSSTDSQVTESSQPEQPPPGPPHAQYLASKSICLPNTAARVHRWSTHVETFSAAH